jgi:hypothetical protein
LAVDSLVPLPRLKKYQFSLATVKGDKSGKVFIGKPIGCYVEQYISFEFRLPLAERMCEGKPEAPGIEAVFGSAGVKAAGRISEPTVLALRP